MLLVASALLFSSLISLIIAALLLYAGAALVGIERVSLGKAIVAVLGGGILSIIAVVLISLTPFSFLAPLVGIIVYIWVVKEVFDTSWLKAFLALLMTLVVFFIVSLFVALILGFSLISRATFHALF